MIYKLCDWLRDGPSSLYIWPRRPEGPKKFEWMKNLHGVLDGNKWITIHDMPHITIGLSKRGGSNVKLEAPTINYITIWLLIILYHCSVYLNPNNCPHACTKLRGPSITKINFQIPMVQPSNEFLGPLDFHGHVFWSMCKGSLHGCKVL